MACSRKFCTTRCRAPARSLRVTKQMGMRGFSAGSMGRNTVVSLGFVSYEMTTLK